MLLVFPLGELGMGLGLVLGVGLGLGSGSGLGLNFMFLAFGVAEKSVPCPASLCEKASWRDVQRSTIPFFAGGKTFWLARDQNIQA